MAQTSTVTPGMGSASPLATGVGGFAADSQSATLPYSGTANRATCSTGDYGQAAPATFDGGISLSTFIDGEAIVVDRNGLSVFDLLRYRQHGHAAVFCAFDLIELGGKGLRRWPIEDRKRALADLLHQKRDGIVMHYDGDGAIIYKHACKLGCEGIVSKQLGWLYRSGRVKEWLKVKNPTGPEVKREAEEDSGVARKRSR